MILKVVVLLLTGWWTIVSENLGQITMDWSLVSSALLTLVLFVAGVQLLGQSCAPQYWKLRWSVSVLLAALLAFLSGLCFTGFWFQTRQLIFG